MKADNRDWDDAAGHTPGPWYCTGSSLSGTVFGGPEHRLIVPHCQTCPACGAVAPAEWNGAEDMANRRLIAAAPDMLAALQGMVARFTEEPGTYTPEGSAARAAIARATGNKA